MGEISSNDDFDTLTQEVYANYICYINDDCTPLIIKTHNFSACLLTVPEE